MTRTPLLFAIATAFTMAACGDDGGDVGSDPDAAPEIDPIDATPPPVCEDLPVSFGELGELAGSALIEPIDELEPDGPRRLALEFDLDQADPPDKLFVELWEDVAPFDDTGFEARTIGLNGLHSDLITCGACVFVAADVSDPAQLDFHMARGGSLDIDTLTLTGENDRIEGSIQDLEVRQVEVSADGQSEVVGGCVSEITSMSFALDVLPSTTPRVLSPRRRGRAVLPPTRVR